MRVEAVDNVLRQDLLLLHSVPLVHYELRIERYRSVQIGEKLLCWTNKLSQRLRESNLSYTLGLRSIGDWDPCIDTPT